jgi:hypothetical protein
LACSGSLPLLFLFLQLLECKVVFYWRIKFSFLLLLLLLLLLISDTQCGG